jgi:hydroxymethylbilane synthase
LERLGLGSRVTCTIGAPTLLHAVGQGALGIEIRADDAESRELLAQVEDWRTAWSCKAERACLRVLEGGCSVPVGVTTLLEEHEGDATEGVGAQAGGSSGETGESAKSVPRPSKLTLTGTVTSLDGSKHVQHTISTVVASAQDAEEVGRDVARTLIVSGAKEILDVINRERDSRVQQERQKDAERALRPEEVEEEDLKRKLPATNKAGSETGSVESSSKQE